MNPFLYLYLAYFFCLDACVVVEDAGVVDVDTGVVVDWSGACVVVLAYSLFCRGHGTTL